jgi:hypothetical protein
MIACLSSGFGKFSRNLMLFGINFLEQSIWMGKISFLLRPKVVPSFGKVCIKSNIFLNGELLLKWGMVITAFLGGLLAT